MNGRLRDYFPLLWIAAMIICALAALFAVGLVSCTKGPETAEDQPTLPASETAQAASAEPSPTPVPTATPEPAPTELAETEDMGEEYLTHFVFLGDSTTYGMGYYDVMPWPQVWTNELGTLDLSGQSYVTIDVYDDDGNAETMTIREAVEKHEPEYLVITLGLNGISYMEEADFKEEYTDLVGAIQSLSPDTKIICHSIYPVIDSQAPDGIDNERINRANGWILEVAAVTGTRYLNSHDVLTDDTGNLREEYCNGDGIHLDPMGFNTMLMNVRTHAYQ